MLQLSESDLSENENIDPEPLKTKKRGKAKNYDPICSFNSLSSAEKALSNVFLENI
jgi:hypothetical protein